jgi:uncharacterized protein GlcG (DUF336 family)
MALGLESALELVHLAQAEAAKVNKAVSVAVVDAGGHTIAVERQDGARPMTPEIAISKAYSAAVMQRPTTMLKGWSQSDPVFFSAVSSMGWRPIVATEGGVTIKRDGEIVGGLGIAGGRAEEDQQIAEAALSALGYELEFEAWGQVKR